MILYTKRYYDIYYLIYHKNHIGILCIKESTNEDRKFHFYYLIIELLTINKLINFI